jgi:hypothetical protein
MLLRVPFFFIGDVHGGLGRCIECVNGCCVGDDGVVVVESDVTRPELLGASSIGAAVTPHQMRKAMRPLT